MHCVVWGSSFIITICLDKLFVFESRIMLLESGPVFLYVDAHVPTRGRGLIPSFSSLLGPPRSGSSPGVLQRPGHREPLGFHCA